jgi:hypothetical protein
MHVPIGRLEQASEAPSGDGGWCPPGYLFQGFSPRVEGLHEDQPAEEEAMATAPHAGHASKQHGDKAGQIGEGEHHGQDYQRLDCVEKRARYKSSFRLHSFGFDFHGL